MINQDIDKFMHIVLPKLIKKAAVKAMQDGLREYLENRKHSDKAIGEAVNKATFILENLQNNTGEPKINTGSLIKITGASEKSNPLPPFLVGSNSAVRAGLDLNVVDAIDGLLDPNSKHCMYDDNIKETAAKTVKDKKTSLKNDLLVSKTKRIDKDAKEL